MLLALAFFGLGLNGWGTYSGIASEDLPPLIFAGGGEVSWGAEEWELALGANFTRVAVEEGSVTLREIYLAGGPRFGWWGVLVGTSALGLASKETEAAESPNYPGLRAEGFAERELSKYIFGKVSAALSLYPTREGVYPMGFLGLGILIRRTP